LGIDLNNAILNNAHIEAELTHWLNKKATTKRSVKMNVKYTNGPWSTRGPEVINEHYGLCIARVECPGWTKRDEEECLANALLISGAPDLIEVLKQCLPIVDAYRRVSGGDGDICAANARHLIKKLTGSERKGHGNTI
jgi:hypothetical protein